jgi:hypothetical protein
MDDPINLLQWPAMIASVAAAWLVAAQSKRRRQHGFWWFIGSNVLWIAWGWHDGAWALIVLQFALAALDIRGLRKNEPPDGRGGTPADPHTESPAKSPS